MIRRTNIDKGAPPDKVLRDAGEIGDSWLRKEETGGEWRKRVSTGTDFMAACAWSHSHA